MTEAEWLACDEPEAMYVFATEEGELTRKSRLLGCTCARRLWHLLNGVYQSAIEVAERYEDGLALRHEIEAAHREGEVATYRDYADDTAIDLARIVVQSVTSPDHPFANLDKAAGAFAWDAGNEEVGWDDAIKCEVAVQVRLVRDIFGNPFRPITFAPAWRTDTALSLARQMYDSRDFGAMPILADALQDAGSDNPDIHTHCRGDGPHVRGCWVVDLILGKE